MIIGALGLSVVMNVALYALVHWLKSTWLPNVVGTIIGLFILVGVSTLLGLVNTAHTTMVALPFFMIGLPLLIWANRFPRKRRRSATYTEYNL